MATEQVKTKSESSLRHKASFVNGIIQQNPLFVSVLGTCPALAVTTSLESAFGMGLLFTFVLICSNVIISLIRKLIPEEAKTPCEIVVIAAFVTIVKLFTQAYLTALYNSLGVFLSLLVVNCIVLGRAEAFATKNTVLDSLLDGIGNGIGYTLAICLIAIIREILGTGMLSFGVVFTFLPEVHLPILANYEGTYNYSLSLFSNPAGGFIVFGLCLAVINLIGLHKQKKEKEKKTALMKAAIKKPQPKADIPHQPIDTKSASTSTNFAKPALEKGAN